MKRKGNILEKVSLFNFCEIWQFCANLCNTGLETYQKYKHKTGIEAIAIKKLCIKQLKDLGNLDLFLKK